MTANPSRTQVPAPSPADGAAPGMSMPGHRPVRRMADVREPVTVFLVGMRINALRRPRAWVPVARAMGPMLTELFRDPELGMLGARTEWSGRTITVISYWRSFDRLEAYARSTDHVHRSAWTAFYKRAAAARGAVGLFHETYTMQPGQVESLYVDMPDGFGLGGAVGSAAVSGAMSAARGRLEGVPRREDDDAAA